MIRIVRVLGTEGDVRHHNLSVSPVHAPAKNLTVRNSKLIADTTNHEGHHVVEPRWSVIPGGGSRQDNGPRTGHLKHVLKVNEAQRRLTWNQDQLGPLLQMDVGGGVIKFVVIPCAIEPKVLMLHGTTTMPAVRNDPLAMPAE